MIRFSPISAVLLPALLLAGCTLLVDEEGASPVMDGQGEGEQDLDERDIGEQDTFFDPDVSSWQPLPPDLTVDLSWMMDIPLDQELHLDLPSRVDLEPAIVDGTADVVLYQDIPASQTDQGGATCQGTPVYCTGLTLDECRDHQGCTWLPGICKEDPESPRRTCEEFPSEETCTIAGCEYGCFDGQGDCSLMRNAEECDSPCDWQWLHWECDGTISCVDHCSNNACEASRRCGGPHTKQCSDFDMDLCGAVGCSWKIGSCGGTPEPCGNLDYYNCEDHLGCEWKP